jgi:hypothetical protein
VANRQGNRSGLSEPHRSDRRPWPFASVPLPWPLTLALALIAVL